MTGSQQAHTPSPLGLRVLHHALAAAALASVMVLAECRHLLQWLDITMLRVITPLAAQVPATTLPPRVVAIDAATYAGDFGMTSPLAQEPLAQLIDRLRAVRPKVLMVDLQVEPVRADEQVRPVDMALSRLAADGIRVVLPLPEVRTDAIDRRTLAWMRGLCSQGLRFGSAEVLMHQGMALRWSDDPRQLAVLARLLATDKQAPADADLCQLAARVGTLQEVHWQARPSVGTRLAGTSTHVLNSGLLREAATRVEGAEALKAGPTGLPPGLPLLALGGTYSSQDRYATAAGELPGVVLHAAIAADVKPATESHALNLVLDIVIGTGLGFLFEAMWGWANRAKARLHHAAGSTSATVPFARLGRCFYAWLLRSTVVWSLPVLLMVPPMLASAMLMDRGLWINPGPLVLGMFLHAMLLQGGGHHVPTLKAFVRHHPASVLAHPVLIGAGIVAIGVCFHG